MKHLGSLLEIEIGRGDDSVLLPCSGDLLAAESMLTPLTGNWDLVLDVDERAAELLRPLVGHAVAGLAYRTKRFERPANDFTGRPKDQEYGHEFSPRSRPLLGAIGRGRFILRGVRMDLNQLREPILIAG